MLFEKGELKTTGCIVMLCMILLLGTQLRAQEKTIYNHQEFWSKIEVNEIFENKLGLGFDFVYRSKSELDNGNMFSSTMRESFRPWLHYQFGPNARFSLSPIGYMETQDYIGKPTDYLRPDYHEFRTTFQCFHHQKQLQGKIMHTWRYRYEMRFQENPLDDSYRYFNRFRTRGTGFEFDHGQGLMIGLYIDQISGLKSGKKSVPAVRFGD